MIPKEIKYNLHYDDVRGDLVEMQASLEGKNLLPEGVAPKRWEANIFMSELFPLEIYPFSL